MLFFKSDGNCLTSWLVTFRKHQNHSLFLHLGWCSCRCQLAEDPANTYFSSESDHWQIAALDVSMAKCPWGTQKLHWAQLKLSSTLLQYSLSTSSNSEPVSISSIASSWICYNSCKTKKAKNIKKTPNPPRFSFSLQYWLTVTSHSPQDNPEESLRNCSGKSDLLNTDAPNP